MHTLVKSSVKVVWICYVTQGEAVRMGKVRAGTLITHVHTPTVIPTALFIFGYVTGDACATTLLIIRNFQITSKSADIQRYAKRYVSPFL